jgi:hypothetical protein
MCPLLQRRVSIDQTTVGQRSNKGKARLIKVGFAYKAKFAKTTWNKARFGERRQFWIYWGGHRFAPALL